MKTYIATLALALFFISPASAEKKPSIFDNLAGVVLVIHVDQADMETNPSLETLVRQKAELVLRRNKVVIYEPSVEPFVALNGRDLIVSVQCTEGAKAGGVFAYDVSTVLAEDVKVPRLKDRLVYCTTWRRSVFGCASFRVHGYAPILETVEEQAEAFALGYLRANGLR